MVVATVIQESDTTEEARERVWIDKFYRLPRNPSLKKLGLSNIKRANLSEVTRICHDHFKEECFEHELQACYLKLCSDFYCKKIKLSIKKNVGRKFTDYA